jgi:NTE family protein
MESSVERKTIDIALQGGGAHGAFTWGVLDRLLEDGRIEFEGVSGTSAGAMNAVVLADGFHDGGPEGARAALRDFWRAVSRSARFSPFQRTPLDRWLGRWTLDTSPGYLFMDLMSRLFSPYDLNPFNLNPLRALLGRLIDFDRVNHCHQLKLFLTATNVRTGQPTVFRQPRITVDTVMASACLPFVFQAVEIEGDEYWDGGYTGNPALFPLVDECRSRDLVIIQINPIVREGRPRAARDILNRLNEITFNSSLIKELRSITLLKELIEVERLEHERYRDMFIHRIHADEELEGLGVSSKLNAEWQFLTHLHAVGRQVAERWLAENFEKLGKESTLDLDALFAGSIRPPGKGPLA